MDKLTDAEIVERMKYRATHSVVETAEHFGCNTRAIQQVIANGKAWGLTAKTKIVNQAALDKARIKSLEAELRSIERVNITAENLRQELYGLAEIPTEPPEWISKPFVSGETVSVPYTLWSDWHWGEVVRKEELGGVNEFNRTIAKKRLHKLVDRIVGITDNYVGKLTFPGIVVALGGDIISGGIHEELRNTNEGTIQECCREAKNELASALTQMADRFGKVYVPCVVGNHGRMSIKPQAKRRVYENFEWSIYTGLQDHFHDDPRLVIHVAEEADILYEVLGHRFLLTHGDALGVKGGDGIIGALGPIARGVFKIGNQSRVIGRDFHTVQMGHWHTYIPRGDALPAIVNGPLKGFDEFAHMILRVPFARASQALGFVHPRYGITSQWQIYVDEAGKASSDHRDWVKFEQANHS